MVYCAEPQEIPENIASLNGAAKEAIVATDRLNLGDCGRRHYLLVQHVDALYAAWAAAQSQE